MLRLIRQQWFLLVLIGVVLFGYFHKGVGVAIRARVDIKYFIMPTLFVMSLTLRTADIIRSFLKLRAIAVAVLGGHLFSTVSLIVLAKLLFPDRQDIAVGLILIGAVPCTLASASIWTRLGGGNDALALAITMVSNISNFILGSAVLFLSLGARGCPPPAELIPKLFVVIVIPVACGQVVRRLAPQYLDAAKILLSNLARLLILLVVLVSVSRAKDTADMAGVGSGIGAMVLVKVALSAALAHLFTLVVCRAIAVATGSTRADSIAVMFGGSQKTLPVGIYLAETFFPTLAFAPLPILFYHAIQLILDSFIVEFIRRGETTPPAESSCDSQV